jgi:taurine dioxygenase
VYSHVFLPKTTSNDLLMTPLSIMATTDHTGVVIDGFDFARPTSIEMRTVLQRALVEHHVVVVRNQRFSPEQFRTAARLFGDLHPHDRKECHVAGHPDIEYVSNDEFLGGRRIIPGETFHTDHSHHPHPPKATTLFALQLPRTGGDTQFVNMHDAYDDLPEDIKRKIGGLRALHVYQSKYSPRKLANLSAESRRDVPSASVHPLVRIHPENGRKVLFLNPVRMETIIGMRDDDALELIELLMRHATQEKYEYRHKWQIGDWVVWDNRSVMHRANPDYDMNERRFLYRLMISDEASF